MYKYPQTLSSSLFSIFKGSGTWKTSPPFLSLVISARGQGTWQGNQVDSLVGQRTFVNLLWALVVFDWLMNKENSYSWVQSGFPVTHILRVELSYGIVFFSLIQRERAYVQSQRIQEVASSPFVWREIAFKPCQYSLCKWFDFQNPWVRRIVIKAYAYHMNPSSSSGGLYDQSRLLFDILKSELRRVRRQVKVEAKLG